MTDSNPTGKVRPMSDQEPPNAAESSGSGPNVRLRAASPTARTLRALPHAVTRRMIGLQQPGSGESRLIGSVRLEAMITIARYGRTTRPRPQRAIAMTVLFVVTIPTA